MIFYYFLRTSSLLWYSFRRTVYFTKVIAFVTAFVSLSNRAEITWWLRLAFWLPTVEGKSLSPKILGIYSLENIVSQWLSKQYLGSYLAKLPRIFGDNDFPSTVSHTATVPAFAVSILYYFIFPLKLFWKTLPITKFSVPQPKFHLQSKNNFYVMQLNEAKNYQPSMIWTERSKILTLVYC